MAARTTKGIIVRPDAKRGGVTTVRHAPAAGPARRLRGEVEVSLTHNGGIKVVDIVDLESYTHGVVAAEMPVGSPLEALKAQAVIARSHALYIRQVSRRHDRDGYDVCDGQHCQVYAGVNIESGRSRAVVDATRGRVVTFQGRVAHVLYASNCGGHTQSGWEVQGWGDVPYWKGVSDGPPDLAAPATPWELRRWLRTAPRAYCRASSFIHGSHFRWTRVIPAADLDEKLDRALKVGRVKRILPLRRAASGHLNSVLVQGSKASRTVTSELRIRGLFGIGSQRSALFILETDYDAHGKARLYTFYGGGWGHGVGLCQSGAMGRAEAGQSYVDILRAYYPRTEMGSLTY